MTNEEIRAEESNDGAYDERDEPTTPRDLFGNYDPSDEQLDAQEMATCEWFALCRNPATLTIAHPILGSVPCCQRCANKLGLVS